MDEQKEDRAVDTVKVIRAIYHEHIRQIQQSIPDISATAAKALIENPDSDFFLPEGDIWFFVECLPDDDLKNHSPEILAVKILEWSEEFIKNHPKKTKKENWWRRLCKFFS